MLFRFHKKAMIKKKHSLCTVINCLNKKKKKINPHFLHHIETGDQRIQISFEN